MALSAGWKTTDGATQHHCSERGEQVEALGPECECWQFISGVGRRSAHSEPVTAGQHVGGEAAGA